MEEHEARKQVLKLERIFADAGLTLHGGGPITNIVALRSSRDSNDWNCEIFYDRFRYNQNTKKQWDKAMEQALYNAAVSEMKKVRRPAYNSDL